MRDTPQQKREISGDARLESSIKSMRSSSRRYGKIDPFTAETFLSFIFTSDQMSTYLSRVTRVYGITRAGINVLVILRGHEQKGCNQQTLSRLLLVSRANVTGLVNNLIRKGLVRRVADGSDRRANIVNISRKGGRLLDSILPKYHEHIAKIYAPLSKNEKIRFNGIMKKLREAVNALEYKSPNE